MSTDDDDRWTGEDAPPAKSPEPRPERKRRKRRRKVEPPPARVKPRSERTVRGFVIGGAAVALAGIAVVGTRDSSFGAALVIGGLLTLIASIHTLGRLGPDEGAPSR